MFLSNSYEAQSLPAVAPPPPNPSSLPHPAVNLTHIKHPSTFTQQFPPCDAFLHRRIHLAVHEYQCDGRAVGSDRASRLVGWLTSGGLFFFCPSPTSSPSSPHPPAFTHLKKTQNDKKEKKSEVKMFRWRFCLMSRVQTRVYKVGETMLCFLKEKNNTTTPDWCWNGLDRPLPSTSISIEI